MSKLLKTIFFSMPMLRNETFEYRLDMYKNDLYPGHFLFGAPELKALGYNIIYSSSNDLKIKSNHFVSLLRSFKYALRIIKDRSIDIIYTPYPIDLDILIYLRAIRVYSSIIIVREHHSIQKEKGFIKSIKQRLYYNGIDRLVFFDKLSANESLRTGLVSSNQIFVDNWGPDLKQYKRILDKYGNTEVTKKITFISTGRDSRDFQLMFDAFEYLEVPFEFYLMDMSLVEKFKGKSKNIKVHYLESSKDSPQIALDATINSDVSMIICQPTRPTANGYTALCEAMGLGKPVIISRNPYIPIDVDKEQFGISVPVGDIDALRTAILTFYNNPDMVREYGKNARKFAEEKYNSRIVAKQLDHLFQNL